MKPITLQPLKTTGKLKCPHCDQPIYRVFKNRTNALQARKSYCWALADYTVPDLKSLLSDEQKKPSGFFYQLSVGSQDCCDQSYYVVKCWFIDADLSGNWKDVCDFFDKYSDGKQAELINYISFYQGDNQFVPSQWIVSQSPSPKGIIQSHFFGPFLAPEDCEDFYDSDRLLIGGLPNMWIASRKLLFTLWDDLKVLIKQPIKV